MNTYICYGRSKIKQFKNKKLWITRDREIIQLKIKIQWIVKTVQKEKVIATWYLEADTKLNSTLAPGNGPILIIVIKRGYCFVFCCCC